MRTTRQWAFAVVAGLLAGWTGQAVAQDTIQYDGSSQVYLAFVKDTADAFTQETQIPVEAKERKTQDAIPSLVAGTCNVGGLARKMNAEEKALGADLVETLVAKDHLAVFVPASSPLTELTPEQVKSVFSGEIKDWQELGDAAGAIQVVIPETKTACNMNFTKMAMGGKATYAASAIVTEIAGKVLDEAAGKRAISFISYGAVRGRTDFKTLKIGGKNPGEEGYPFAQEFYLATKGEPSGVTQKYIEYFLAGAGKTFIEQAGLLPAK